MIETIQEVTLSRFGAAAEAEALAGRIAEVFSASGYPVLRGVVVEHHEGVVVLRGRVPTFYLKQVAQTVASKVPGVDLVVNHLQVG